MSECKLTSLPESASSLRIAFIGIDGRLMPRQIVSVDFTVVKVGHPERRCVRTNPVRIGELVRRSRVTEQKEIIFVRMAVVMVTVQTVFGFHAVRENLLVLSVCVQNQQDFSILVHPNAPWGFCRSGRVQR